LLPYVAQARKQDSFGTDPSAEDSEETKYDEYYQDMTNMPRIEENLIEEEDDDDFEEDEIGDEEPWNP